LLKKKYARILKKPVSHLSSLSCWLKSSICRNSGKSQDTAFNAVPKPIEIPSGISRIQLQITAAANICSICVRVEAETEYQRIRAPRNVFGMYFREHASQNVSDNGTGNKSRKLIQWYWYDWNLSWPIFRFNRVFSGRIRSKPQETPVNIADLECVMKITAIASCNE
jgi:hypothetical protein